MKLFIFILCAFLKLSGSTPVQNASAESNVLQFNKNSGVSTSFQTGILKNSFTISEILKSSSSSKRPYFFISIRFGRVLIIDGISYDEINLYFLLALSESISVIVGDTFYNIVTQNGTIFSTNLANMMNGPNYITWNLVGSFPPAPYYIRNAAAVDGSFIYFVTGDGKLYIYDTLLRTVTKLLGTIKSGDAYASLVVVNHILYIHKYSILYSYDGTVLTQITTPDVRFHPGIFKKGNSVCRVGGIHADVEPDPIMCYNPKDKKWSTESYVNEARLYPGIAAIGSKTYVFGGNAHFSSSISSSFWRNSTEVLNCDTNIWSYIPTRLITGQQQIQAVSFYF